MYFFSNSELPKVIGQIEFDETFDTETASIIIESRDMTEYETDLYQIWESALFTAINDTLIEIYSNTSLNYIPIIRNNERKVFIVTGSTLNGYIFLGNDYGLEFNDINKMISKKKIHNNLIPIRFLTDTGEYLEDPSSLHNHSSKTGDYITSTDICTLLLNKDFTKWKMHHVLTPEYLNFFNLESKTISFFPRDAYDKMNKNEDKKD